MIRLTPCHFIRVGAAVPQLRIANPAYNLKQIAALAKKAAKHFVKVLVFPELSVTAYSCEDLFYQPALLCACEKQLLSFLSATKQLDIMLIIGMPLRSHNRLYNCALVTLRGEILAAVPKTYLSSAPGSPERRWFSSANETFSNHISILGKEIPFSNQILLQESASGLTLGIEICEDLWTAVPPSSFHAINGANVIVNLSASPAIAGKNEKRRDVVRMQSQKCCCAYAYASASPFESTTDCVYSGHSLMASLGHVTKEAFFTDSDTLIYNDIDLDEIQAERSRSSSFAGTALKRDYHTIPLTFLSDEADSLVCDMPANPFLSGKTDSYLQEILDIQATALARRLTHIGYTRCVVGVSGGLDSTLALLVTAAAFDKMQVDRKNIFGIRMPGFGTSNRTHDNAELLMKLLSVTALEIPIADACTAHLQNIFHGGQKDLTYENTQARERTQVLMDYAGSVNAIVVGTGDLSELALGFCTYNGDHMSMYSLNGSIPKTVIRALICYTAENTYAGQALGSVLLDILSTPVSPELLPPDDNGVTQKTEQILGDYDVHDFILYHVLKNHFSPEKIAFLMKIAFRDRYDEAYLHNCLQTFFKRFFSQQFKRNCSPDGVQAIDFSLSPRGGFQMSSDADSAAWINLLQQEEGSN